MSINAQRKKLTLADKPATCIVIGMLWFVALLAVASFHVMWAVWPLVYAPVALGALVFARMIWPEIRKEWKS